LTPRKQVQVIGHVAVRRNRELLIDGGAKDLCTHDADSIRRREVLLPLKRAESQEIPVDATVIESLEVFWFTGAHAYSPANDGPRPGPPEGGHYVWLKVDTRAGPPEGGHYVWLKVDTRAGPAEGGHYV
jgi:hypothetical protein